MATTNDKQVIFSLVNVGKVYPPKRQVLREIYLGFYYGAKIGVPRMADRARSLHYNHAIATGFHSGTAPPLPAAKAKSRKGA